MRGGRVGCKHQLNGSCQTCGTPIHKTGKFCKRCYNLPQNCTRLCPTCNKVIVYSFRNNMVASKKRGLSCVSCTQGVNKKGKGNSFYGKIHSLESKLKMSNSHKGHNLGIKNPRKGHGGSDNSMYGISLKEKWIQLYGVEEAEKRYNTWRNKITINNKKTMLGVPSPIGSGNGISGWYKGWYFRSINELSYMIFVIERFKLKWRSAESKEYSIPYIDYNGNNRNYFCDFIINEKFLVEIKPKALQKTKDNILKFLAAKESEKYKFKVTFSPRILKKGELKVLLESGEVILTKKWENKLNL